MSPEQKIEIEHRHIAVVRGVLREAAADGSDHSMLASAIVGAACGLVGDDQRARTSLALTLLCLASDLDHDVVERRLPSWWH